MWFKKFYALLAVFMLTCSVHAGPPSPPDQLIDAICGDVVTHPIQLVYFTVTPQTDGTQLATFIIRGVGKWSLYEVCPDATQRVMASGIDDVDGDYLHLVILPNDGMYVRCGLELFNMHGYPGLFNPGQLP